MTHVQEHRRRAQGPTQNMQDQSEYETAGQQELLVEESQTSLQSAAQTVPQRRRRNALPLTEQEQNQSPEKQTAPHVPESKTENAPMPQTGEKNTKSKKILSAPRTLRGERLKGVVNSSARFGKTAVQGLGGLLVLAMLLLSEGAKKLRKTAGKVPEARSDSKNRKIRPGDAQPEQPYELELIRPEEYHGRGQEHARKTAAHHKTVSQNKTARRKNAQMINRMTSAALVCVALFSLWQIGSIVARSVRTRSLNNELSRQRAEAMEQAQPESDEQAQPELAYEMESAPLPGATADVPQATAAPTPEPEPTAVLAVATPAPEVVKTTKYHHMGGEALAEMAALYEKNRDLVAWIQIPDVLDLPVVYRDNSYYLKRDFNKQKNAAGTIFLDVNHPFKEKTQNLLLHGHNMKDGTMFGRLAQYLYDDTYIRNHPFIYFDTLWRKEQYVILAILDVSLDTKNPRFFNYFTHDTFSSDAEFGTYIRQLQLRSRYAIPIDVQPGDALLTLSTCLEEDRLVIVARRLRENETRSELRTLIRMTTKQ